MKSVIVRILALALVAGLLVPSLSAQLGAPTADASEAIHGAEAPVTDAGAMEAAAPVTAAAPQMAARTGVDEPLPMDDGPAAAARDILGTVAFEKNDGQFQEGVRFVTRITGGEAAFYDDRIVARGLDGSEVVLRLPGSTTPVGVGQQPGVVHHYTADVQATAARYDAVHYDLGTHRLEVYGVDGTIEFDHVLPAGTDPGIAGFTVEGAVPRVLADGGLGLGDGLHLAAPVTFQEGPDGREPVASSYVVDGQQVGYAVEAHDPTRPLVIDPMFHYVSYAGGSSTEYVYSIDVADHPTDPGKTRVVLGGRTYSSSFATGAPAFTYGSMSSSDMFVMVTTYEVRTQTMTLDWLAAMGTTSCCDYLYDAVFDSNGGVLFIGYTSGSSWPLVAPISDANADGTTGQGSYDLTIGRLDDTGVLTFSSYLGGEGSEYARAITETAAGNIAVTGYTYSTGYDDVVPYPLTSDAYDAPELAMTTSADAFFTVIEEACDGTNACLRYSTLLRGTGSDYGYGIAADTDGIYLAGYTTTDSGDLVQFPTTAGSWDDTRESTGTRGWAARFAPEGGDPMWVTFLGDDQGTSSVYARDVAPSGGGAVWVGGYTYTDFPTCSWCTLPAFQPARAGSTDGYVLHMKPDGTNITYASFVGGTSSDYVYGMDYERGLLAVGGETYSGAIASLPSPAIRSTGTSATQYGVRIDTATGLPDVFGYYGGASSYSDNGEDVALDSNGLVYTLGYTSSTVTTYNALQSTGAGSYDGLVAIIGKAPPTAAIVLNASYMGHPAVDSNDTALYEVLTWTDVDVHGFNTTAGDFPLNTNATWTVKDSAGTVVATHTGLGVPSFSPLNLTDDGEREVCLEVWDTDPAMFLSTDDACITVRWLNRAPTADIAPAPIRIQSGKTLTINDASSDLDGIIATARWDFGDSTPYAYGTTVNHVFASSGTYTITLNVTDDDGAFDETTYVILVDDGPASFFSNPTDKHLGEAVPFTELAIPGDFDIEQWTWDFGDGSPTVARFAAGHVIDHVFPDFGPYLVTLTVEDKYYVHSYSQNVTVAPLPPTGTPDVIYTRPDTPVTAIDSVLANDFSPHGIPLDVASYTQPDGSVGLDADGVPTYTPPSGWIGETSFTYELTDGHNVVDVPVAVHVVDWLGPKADFDFSIHGDDVVFDDTSRKGDAPIVTYLWSFGDGTTATGTAPTHAFGPGHHAVELVVVDERGLLDRITKRFFISSASVEPVEGLDPPVAKAGGPENVRAGDTVSLFAEGTGLHHAWRQLAGPSVRLMGADTAAPSFLVPAVGPEGAELVFELVSYDGRTFSEPVTLAIQVSHKNHAPAVAIEVPVRTAGAHDAVSLVASATDIDGDATDIRWTQRSGPKVELDDHGDGTASFRAPALEGTAVFEATATDGLLSARETAEVVLTGDGGTSAFFEATVAPTGLVSFTGTPGVGHQWDFGDDSPVGAGAQPTHQYDEDGEYLVTLVVTDDQGRTARMQRLVDVQIDADAFRAVPMPTEQEEAVAAAAVKEEASLPTTAISVLVVAAVLAAAAGLAVLLRRR